MEQEMMNTEVQKEQDTMTTAVQAEQYPVTATGEAMMGSKVEEYENDVATRVDEERMYVSRPGRHRYQRVYMWTASKSGKSKGTTTNEKYSPKPEEGNIPERDNDRDGDLIPTPQELTDAADTKLYLEVGMIDAQNPELYVDKGKGIGGIPVQAKKERADRGINPRAKRVLRVFLAIEQTITTSPKYYVGCRMVDGRCFQRGIGVEAIFFYSEFTDRAWDVGSSSKLSRRKAINEVLVNEVAINKTRASKATVAISSVSDLEKTIRDKLFTVTPYQDITNLIVLQFGIYNNTHKIEDLLALTNTIDKLLPNQAYGREIKSGAIALFYDFAEGFGIEEAHDLKTQAKPFAPEADSWDAIAIVELRDTLRENKHLRDRLEYSGLGFFLRFYFRRLLGGAADKDEGDAPTSTSATESVRRGSEEAIADALEATELHVSMSPSTWMSEKIAGAKIETDDYVAYVWSVKECINEVIKHMSAHGDELARQHGGLLTYKSVGELTERLGQAISKTEVQTAWQQLAAFHGAQFATYQHAAQGMLEKIVANIEQLLAGHSAPTATEATATEEDDEGMD